MEAVVLGLGEIVATVGHEVVVVVVEGTDCVAAHCNTRGHYSIRVHWLHA